MDWSEDQIAALLDEHRPAVRAVLRRLGRGDGELADLEQETLLRALLSIDELRAAGRFRPWIQSIARNVALGRVRSAQRARRREDEWYQETAGHGTLVIQEAEAGLVELGLREVPDADALLLRRHYLEGCGGRDLALELHITEAAARQRLRRARERLKEAIMDMVREDRDTASQLVDRMLQSTVRLTQEGRYQQAVSKLLETFNQFPGSLTAIAKLPREVRESLRDSWGEVFQYVPPVQEPRGADSYEELEELAAQLPETEQDGLTGTIGDISRRLEVSPAWIYRWWLEGMPHRREEGGIIRFRLDLVRKWRSTGTAASSASASWRQDVRQQLRRTWRRQRASWETFIAHRSTCARPGRRTTASSAPIPTTPTGNARWPPNRGDW